MRLQLSFLDPGARSMGMGGAFIGLADDATAAFANPAGLVQIVRPEISLEGRLWDYSLSYTEGGRLVGEPTGIGIDDAEGTRTASSDERLSALAFLSFVYPKDRWSFALFRHVLSNTEFFSETQGLFVGEDPCCTRRLPDQRSLSDVLVVTYGATAAYRFSESFSLGFGLTYFDVSVDARADLFLWDDDTPESFFGPNSYLPERMVASQTLSIDDTGLGFSVGLLWKISEQWRIGGVYRSSPEVELGNRLIAGPANNLGLPSGSVIGMATENLDLPEVYALGLTFRSGDERFTASLQWDRVLYSRIFESIQVEDQKLNDGDELHLGGEYVFLKSSPLIAVRLGAWLEPYHQGESTVDDPLLRAMFPPGDDELHYSIGLGFGFNTFQIDVGADVSEQVNTMSVSGIYSF